jgi:CheY-like chemotaxis protein
MVPPSNCFTVLVVDDQLPNRILLRKFLQAVGYAAVEASDGVEALALLEGDHGLRPDLIITDIEMPELSGIPLIQRIRQMDGSVDAVPIIAASGNADPEMQREALQAGADLFLTKPFDLSSLRRDVASLITGKRRRSESMPIDSAGSEVNRLAERTGGSPIKSETSLGVKG